MNANVSKMLNAYGQAQADSGVATASPHKLIALLYDGALVAIANASVHLERGDIPARGAAISRAIAIIDEGLKVSIDLDAGGELAQNLVALYEYMSYRLLSANIKADRAGLDEVAALLKDLKSAWDAIGDLTEVKPAMTEPDHPRVSASYGAA